MSDPTEIAESVEFILSEWSRQGHAFFFNYQPGREHLERLVRDPQPPDLMDDERDYIRIALHLRLYEIATARIEAALRQAPPTATLFIADLRELKTRCEKRS